MSISIRYGTVDIHTYDDPIRNIGYNREVQKSLSILIKLVSG